MAHRASRHPNKYGMQPHKSDPLESLRLVGENHCRTIFTITVVFVVKQLVKPHVATQDRAPQLHIAPHLPSAAAIGQVRKRTCNVITHIASSSRSLVPRMVRLNSRSKHVNNDRSIKTSHASRKLQRSQRRRTHGRSWLWDPNE